jgi:hypothetical protein
MHGSGVVGVFGSSTKVLPRDAVKRRASLPMMMIQNRSTRSTPISQVPVARPNHIRKVCRINSSNSQNAELFDSPIKEFDGCREVFGLD